MTKRSCKAKSLDLIVIEQEPRIDSRLMADRLGIQHKNFVETIRRYENKISEFGIIPFQTEVLDGRGQLQRNTFLKEFGQLPFETQVGARSQG
jgi:phage regulator Rha-like protein